MATKTIRLIARARRWLNLRLALGLTALHAALGLVLGNAALLVADLAGEPPLPWLGPLLGLALGVALGLLTSRRRAVNAMEAAAWADRSLHAKSLLSSALYCLERGLSGPLDAAILEKAEALSVDAGRLRPSFLPIRRRLLASAAIAAASFLSLALPLDPPDIVERGPGLGAARTEDPSEGEGPLNPELNPDLAEEAKKEARALFPDDQRMRSLAEKALLEGRKQDLRELAERAMKDLDARIASSESLLERHDLALKKRQLAQGVERNLSAAAKPAATVKPELEDQDKSVSEEFLPFDRKPAEDSERRDGPRNIEGGMGEDSQGSIAGIGKGSQVERGAIEARATGERIELRKGDTPDLSELMEAAQRGAVAAGRAAWAGSAQESASGGSLLPLDYKMDVQSYFTALERLTRAAAGQTTEGAKE